MIHTNRPLPIGEGKYVTQLVASMDSNLRWHVYVQGDGVGEGLNLTSLVVLLHDSLLSFT